MVCSIRSSVLFLLLLSGLAVAAPASETAARAAAQEGKTAFDLGDWAKAIERYEEAYKLKAAPGLLFNLGQSHRRAGNLDKASFYFRRYLETNPPEVQAKATEEVLAQLDAARAEKAEQDRKAEELRQLEAVRLLELHRLEAIRTLEIEEQQRQLELEKARLAVVNAHERRLSLEAELKKEAPPPPVLVTQRWWFWTAIGAVVVGTAVTITAVATAPQPVQTTFPDINAR